MNKYSAQMIGDEEDEPVLDVVQLSNGKFLLLTREMLED